MLVVTYLLTILFMISSGIFWMYMFIYESIGNVLSWTNKKLAIAVIWSEYNLNIERGMEPDPETYKQYLEEINKEEDEEEE